MDRNGAYAALSDLIFKGFLTTEMDLDGELFVFKTVNEREFDLMRMLSGSTQRPDHDFRFNLFFVSYSLFVANGHNYLFDRERNIEELYSLFSKIPWTLFKKIMEKLNELRNVSYDALKYLEGFSYTGRSRNYWRSLNEMSPCQMSGIPGVAEIGMNVHQESWVLINRSMDMEENHNREFYLSLMVASASNPKGSRGIRNQHDTQQRMAEERRKKLAEVGFIDTKAWRPDGWAAPVDTAEELVAELERQMEGKKDKHDLLMERYMENMRKSAEAKAKAAEDRLRKARENADSIFIDGGQRALTPEETKELMNRKVSRTVTVESETSVKGEDKARFLSKIGNRVLTGA